jgi:hypothetical protein
VSTRLDQDRRKRERERAALKSASDAVMSRTGNQRPMGPLGAVVLIAALVFIGWALVSCSQNMSDGVTRSSRSGVPDCVSRGISYFREIGSYPTLSDGRDAVTVATERCSRTAGAFP